MNSDNLSELTQRALLRVRQKLLDLSKRNRLLNFKETTRSIRLIDEIPNQVFKTLVTELKSMTLLFDERNTSGQSSELSQEEFVIRTIKELQLKGFQGIHATHSGFYERFRKEFDGKDPSKVLAKMEADGVITSKSVKTGLIITLTGKPLSKNIDLSNHHANDSDLNRHDDLALQTPYSATILERRSGRILQDAKTAIEETGSNFLFLSIGFLEWYDDEESDISYKAPLILVPIQLEKGKIDRENNCYTYKLTYTEEDIETNLSLALKLDKDDIVLPEVDDQTEPQKYLEDVSRLIKHKKHWRVVPDMVIGMFSFAKILMYKDLDSEKWPSGFFNLTENEKIREVLRLKETFSDTDNVIYDTEHMIDGNEAAEKIPLILDADSSQHSVIIDAMDSKDIVVEGPPGTGKSQTITNLIAAALYEGKSVLFVAEKKAALEVVRRRLDQAGLGDFCLELHSTKTQKGKLREDIRKRLERQFTRPGDLKYISEDLISERDKLHEYMNLISSVVGPSGEKIYEIMWKAERWRTELPKDHQNIQFAFDNSLRLKRGDIQDRVSTLAELSQLFKDLPQATIKTFKGFKPSLYPGDEHNLKTALLELLGKINSISEFMDGVIDFHKLPVTQTYGDVISISGINKQLLSSVPDNFEQSIVSKVVYNNAARTFYKLRDDITAYNNCMITVESYLKGHHDLSMDRVTELKGVVKSVESFGYGNYSLESLNVLISKAEKAIRLLFDLKTIAEAVRGILIDEIDDFSHFQRLISLFEVILKAPPDIDINKHTAHIYQGTPFIFNKAKTEAVELKEKIDDCAQSFHISRLPNYTELRQIAADLKRYSGSFFSFLSPGLRRTKRTISGFVVDEALIKQPQMVSMLYELADTLEKVKRIENELETQRTLGPLFKGIDTEWERLEGHVTWAQSLRDSIVTQSSAEKILENISQYRDVSSKLYGKTKNIIDEIDTIFKSLLIVKHDTLNMESDDAILLTCLACNTNNKVPADKLSDKPICGRCRTPLDVPRLSIDDAINKNQKIIKELRTAFDDLSPFVVNNTISIKEIVPAFNGYIDATNIYKSVNEDTLCKDICGCFFKGIQTDVSHLCSLADWVDNILDNGNIPDKITKWVFSNETPNKLSVLGDCVNEVENFLAAHSDITSKIDHLGEIDEYLFFGQHLKNCEISALANKLQDCMEQFDYLFLWSDYCKACEKVAKIDLSAFTDALEEGSLAPDHATTILNFSIYNSMARDLIRQEPILASFTTAGYDNTRDRFVELDRKIMDIYREEIASKLSYKVAPKGNGSGPVGTWTDMSLITNELNKRKRHIPTRQLIRRAGNALKALKPCFMMSPLSVAQYLVPGQTHFELVVMDEASQIRPEDALGAFARGSQVVIVGDLNQLPPTTFFDRINENYDDEEAIALEDSESILNVCKEIYKARRLRWHYRSEHESLISFSNREFYDDDLIVFPSPFRGDDQLGVQYHYVEDAAYSKGRNIPEAQTIVNAVIEHFRNTPKISLGVATFNREQRDLIEDLLDKRRKQDSWLDNIIKAAEEQDEPFFIKNLENVQGDERDVIFISFTYGPDKSTGKVYQRFGPIGNESGWRRLNVIFTRAKKRVKIFTSMKPTDIIITESTKRGVQTLRSYLDFAMSGNFVDYGKISKKDPDSDFEIAVARQLNSLGYETAFQVGVAGFFIDLGVIHPQRSSDFLLGIECDGATFHSGKSVRDRDRLRQEILEKKGWKIHRIWSTDWFKNREKEIEKLLKVIRQIEEKDKVRVIPVKPEPPKAAPKQSYVQDTPLFKSDNDLRNELLDYRKVNIEPQFADQSKGILRDEMIDAWVEFKPTTKEEFLVNIPRKLRENIDSKQVQFRDDIFQIIEEYL